MNMYTLQGETFLVHDGEVFVKLNPVEQDQKGIKSARLCGLCHEPGHRKENCPKSTNSTS